MFQSLSVMKVLPVSDTGVDVNAMSNNEGSGDHSRDDMSTCVPRAAGVCGALNATNRFNDSSTNQESCDSNDLTRTPSEKLQGRILTPFTPEEADSAKSV